MHDYNADLTQTLKVRKGTTFFGYTQKEAQNLRFELLFSQM